MSIINQFKDILPFHTDKEVEKVLLNNNTIFKKDLSNIYIVKNGVSTGKVIFGSTFTFLRGEMNLGARNCTLINRYFYAYGSCGGVSASGFSYRDSVFNYDVMLYPNVHIEYEITGRGTNPNNYIHSLYANEYGHYYNLMPFTIGSHSIDITLAANEWLRKDFIVGGGFGNFYYGMSGSEAASYVQYTIKNLYVYK